MPANPEIVRELRNLFTSGATPSRLLLHIFANHGPEDNWHSIVQDYFSEAFGIPFARVSPKRERYARINLENYVLNTRLLHNMVQTRSQWENEASCVPGSEGGWLDSLIATDEDDLVNQADPAKLAGLSQCWLQLDPAAQDSIRRLLGNSTLLYQRMMILARLAESLQKKVVELEERLSDHAE
jgi:hypothetical protein